MQNISKELRNPQPLNKRVSLNFEERLDIDTNINQLLEHLLKAKVELLDIG